MARGAGVSHSQHGHEGGAGAHGCSGAEDVLVPFHLMVSIATVGLFLSQLNCQEQQVDMMEIQRCY